MKGERKAERLEASRFFSSPVLAPFSHLSLAHGHGIYNGKDHPETHHRFPAPLLLPILTNEKNTELPGVNPKLSAQ
jgi:hypothetical protein